METSTETVHRICGHKDKDKPVQYPPFWQQCKKEDHDRLNFIEAICYDQKSVNDAQQAVIENLLTTCENLHKRIEFLERQHVNPDLVIPVEVASDKPKTLADLIEGKTDGTV